MKKLQLALLALVLGGMFAADADARCSRNRCKPSRCETRCKRACPKECEEVCEPFVETKSYCKTMLVEFPVQATRECQNVTTICKTKRCDKDCWNEQPCTIKVFCEGEPVGTYDSNGNKIDAASYGE